MCGICGVVFRDRERVVDEETLIRMRDTMLLRGPDDAGVVVEGHWGLGHRRLSILDLSARARQPMESASGRYCLTYNGEIYNFRQLRDELQARGHEFRSEGDSEVLVESIDAWGLAETLRRLDGIFAFAVWDRGERRLLGARDHFGIKPFYYAELPQAFYFASSIKALWAAGLERAVDPDVLEELLVFRYIAGQSTPFRGARELPPGHFLELSNGFLRIQPYWRAVDHVTGERERPERWVELFRGAVRDQRVSDVPVGTFLSGGLDSSTLTAELASSQSDPLHTFTVSVPNTEGTDEWPYAEALAERWGCRAHRLGVPADRVLDRLRVAQRQHDEPLAHGNDLYFYELSRLAKEHVTVLLSGEGADETLGGYVRYQPVRWPWLWALATSGAAAPLRAALTALGTRSARTLRRMLALESFFELLLYNAADVLPEDLTYVGLEARARFDVRRGLLEEAAKVAGEPIKQLMLYDLQTFLCSLLNRNDRMTMGASIECRVPFLSVGLVEAALRLPLSELFVGTRGKQILRRFARGRVPSSVLRRPKWGLGVPWTRYIRRDPACRAFVEALPKSELARALGATRLQTVLDAFLSGDDRWAPMAYQLFSLGVWWEQVVERPLEKVGRC